MSYFLWIEDFASVSGGEDIAHNVLGGIIDPTKLLGEKKKLKRDLKSEGVFIELTFGDGLDFIQGKLDDIDYIILDINLPAYSDSEPKFNVLWFLEKWHGYIANEPGVIEEAALVKSAKSLQDIAGYHLYTELIFNQSFPKENILFCSNHGNDLKSIIAAFDSAKMELPQIHKKEDTDVIQAWVKGCYENPYSRLRRGIIEGCRYLKTQKEKLRFDKFSADEKKPAFLDIDDYLDVLENFLPLRKPRNNAVLYKLFIRTLAHEWEESVKPKKIDDDQATLAFSWIMKMTRNWMAHNSTAIFNNLTEQDVAYLFICNMRAIFNLGEHVKNYEKSLFMLFNKSEDSEAFKESEQIVKEKRIPLVKNYVSYFNEKTSRTQVHNILHDLQTDKVKLNAKGDDFFITGLYHSFWFLTSEHDDKKDKAVENNRNPNQVYISRHYTFSCFDYTQSAFLLKFSSHIYSRSFSQGEKS